MSGSDQSQNLTEETADAGQGDLSTAEVICGDWWEDQWFSPYIRARFQLQAPSARLVVRAYNPAVTGQRNGILVRIGADVLFRSDEVPPDGWIEVDEAIPASYLSDGSCDISLRAFKTWTPEGGDTRLMGLLLVDWRVDS